MLACANGERGDDTEDGLSMVDIVGLAANSPLRSIESWLRQGQGLTLSIGAVGFAQFGCRDDDAQALHAIRNHASVRPFMPTPEPLPLARHLAWVADQLLQPGPSSPLILIGRAPATQEPLGFGLLKPVAEAAGMLEVGAMVVGPWQRSPLPTRLVAALVAVARQLFGAETLQTHVNSAHAQALRFNRGWGLQEMPSGKPGELCLSGPIAEVLATPLYRRCVRGLRIGIRPKE